MSGTLLNYLSALEARDAREKAHEKYINAYTRLADRTAGAQYQSVTPEEPTPSPSASIRLPRPSTPKGKGSTTADIASPANISQLRAELALAQKTRGGLESRIIALANELEGLKVTDNEQRRRITRLENVRQQLERQVRDRADEIKGKGKFVEDVQDEMVALQLEFNISEQERTKLQKENDELTKRWVEKMEEEATKMNDRMGWKGKSSR